MSTNDANNEKVETEEIVENTVETEAEDNAAEGSQISSDEQVVALQEEVGKFKDQFVRAQAEMENIRRRAEMDVEKAHKFALEKFSKELLPVVDSLEKALESIGDEEQFTVVREGVSLTLNMLVSALGKFKVEQVDPVGEPFDPQLHEAMSMVDAPGAEPNSVVAVMQKGYTLNGRLVRPAMVMVSKAGAPGAQIDEQA